MDLVILVPNGLGAILGFIQVFLCMVAPRKEILASGEIEVNDVERSVEELADVDVGTADTDIEANDVEETPSSTTKQSKA